MNLSFSAIRHMRYKVEMDTGRASRGPSRAEEVGPRALPGRKIEVKRAGIFFNFSA